MELKTYDMIVVWYVLFLCWYVWLVVFVNVKV